MRERERREREDRGERGGVRERGENIVVLLAQTQLLAPTLDFGIGAASMALTGVEAMYIHMYGMRLLRVPHTVTQGRPRFVVRDRLIHFSITVAELSGAPPIFSHITLLPSR